VELDLSDGLEAIRLVEETVLGVKGSTLHDRIVIRTICRTVAERAARLTACAIAAVVHRINIPGTVVAVDGSLFEAHASFRQRLVKALDSLGCHCPLVLSKDGSGLGAALIAAAATHQD
jgi:hexokinase